MLYLQTTHFDRTRYDPDGGFLVYLRWAPGRRVSVMSVLPYDCLRGPEACDTLSFLIV